MVVQGEKHASRFANAAEAPFTCPGSALWEPAVLGDTLANSAVFLAVKRPIKRRLLGFKKKKEKKTISLLRL